jgi:CDP-glucose 4,6-dehydratase
LCRNAKTDIAWLVSQLVDIGSNVVCLVRDLVPQSEGVRNRRIEHVNTVRGDITDRDLLERALGEGDGSR